MIWFYIWNSGKQEGVGRCQIRNTEAARFPEFQIQEEF